MSVLRRAFRGERLDERARCLEGQAAAVSEVRQGEDPAARLRLQLQGTEQVLTRRLEETLAVPMLWALVRVPPGIIMLPAAHEGKGRIRGLHMRAQPAVADSSMVTR